MWEKLIDEVEKLDLSFEEFLSLYKLYSFKFNSRKINYNSEDFETFMKLEGKGLIRMIDTNGVLSMNLREKGVEIINQFISNTTTEINQLIPVKTDNTKQNSKFEEFWELFPSSDSHGVFKRTRLLKASKTACEKKYKSFLIEGISHDDIMKALKYEINFRKSTSIKDNKLTFMKNSLTWLNQKEFEVILESIDEDDLDDYNDNWTSNLV